MLETQEIPVQELSVVEHETLDDILPAVQRLTAHDKLVLIRILAQELDNLQSNTLGLPPGVYYSYTPYEISGNTRSLKETLESAPPPPTNTSDEN